VVRRVAGVAEEEAGDAELQVELLGVGRVGFEFLLERLGGVAQGAELRPPLRQRLAELLDRARVAVLAFDQQCFQIDQHRLVHAVRPSSRRR
jgi:hypothetical protein